MRFFWSTTSGAVFRFLTVTPRSQCVLPFVRASVYISYVHIDIQVGHNIRIACITGAFPTHIPTYIYIYILRCSTHPFVQRESILAWFSQLYKYRTWYTYTLYVCIYIYLHDLLSVTGMVYTTSWQLVIVWRQWTSSPGAFGWLSNGPDGYGLEVGFPFQHLGRFWWKRWMLDVEIEDNLGIFLCTPFFFRRFCDTILENGSADDFLRCQGLWNKFLHSSC